MRFLEFDVFGHKRRIKVPAFMYGAIRYPSGVVRVQKFIDGKNGNFRLWFGTWRTPAGHRLYFWESEAKRAAYEKMLEELTKARNTISKLEDETARLESTLLPLYNLY